MRRVMFGASHQSRGCPLLGQTHFQSVFFSISHALNKLIMGKYHYTEIVRGSTYRVRLWSTSSSETGLFLLLTPPWAEESLVQ